MQLEPRRRGVFLFFLAAGSFHPLTSSLLVEFLQILGFRVLGFSLGFWVSAQQSLGSKKGFRVLGFSLANRAPSLLEGLVLEP